MATKYTPADSECLDRVNALIERYYPHLKDNEVTIELLFATADEGQPLKHGGYPAAAIVRIVSEKDRVKGNKDAEICIDQLRYEEMSAEEKDALLDHELYHLVVKYDDHEAVKRDSADRPKLGMRKHDHQFGWFAEIAKRHGEASGEVRQAREMVEGSGQAYFTFMTELRLVPKGDEKPKRRSKAAVDEPAAAA